jgi:hypothetical protein
MEQLNVNRMLKKVNTPFNLKSLNPIAFNFFIAFLMQMNESKKRIELKFNCQENLESMSCSEKGKFCTSCQKEVIDFTRLSYSEIQQVKGDQTEMCGIFLAEQLDPSLHPIALPKVRSLAFLSTILLSLNFGNVSAQSTVDPKWNNLEEQVMLQASLHKKQKKNRNEENIFH